MDLLQTGLPSPWLSTVVRPLSPACWSFRLREVFRTREKRVFLLHGELVSREVMGTHLFCLSLHLELRLRLEGAEVGVQEQHGWGCDQAWVT